MAEDRKDWRNLTEPDGPTTVLVNLFVRSFEKIDDVKMEFSVQITFRQQWNDNRCASSRDLESVSLKRIEIVE